MPSGMVVRTTEEGWSIRSFVLGANKKKDDDGATSALTAERPEVGIASGSNENKAAGVGTIR